ncbi:PD-(D/E)XK nuclease family protein [Sulfurisphaera ohwakuensis]|uniref:PD-(D/E)XK nuclease family protein n=1 Tax=Sulfurisphaera ohwakuensis TaxID=69656 RepID=UPI0036F2D581
MSLEEEIKKVLLNNPSILIDVLTARPEIIYQVLAKLTPWQNLATKQDIEKLSREIEDIKQNMATKQELEEIKKTMATKDDIKRLETIITGLGARWGIMNEDSFRQGIREILSSTGWKVSREILYDKDGYVYEEPSDIEYDIIVKDGNVILIEITSSLKRGDLPIIKRKKELYEKVKNVKITLVYVITPFVHDRYPERVKAMAKDMGIEVIYP